MGKGGGRRDREGRRRLIMHDLFIATQPWNALTVSIAKIIGSKIVPSHNGVLTFPNDPSPNICWYVMFFHENWRCCSVSCRDLKTGLRGETEV